MDTSSDAARSLPTLAKPACPSHGHPWCALGTTHSQGAKQELDPSCAAWQPGRWLGSHIHVHQGCWVWGSKQLQWKPCRGCATGGSPQMGSDAFRVSCDRTVTWSSAWENLLPSGKASGPIPLSRELPNLRVSNLQCKYCRGGSADDC